MCVASREPGAVTPVHPAAAIDQPIAISKSAVCQAIIKQATSMKSEIFSTSKTASFGAETGLSHVFRMEVGRASPGHASGRQPLRSTMPLRLTCQ